MVYGTTSHNRSVYAPGAKAPSGSVLARSIASLIPTPIKKIIENGGTSYTVETQNNRDRACERAMTKR
jgi:hypothetical protein